MKNEFISYEQAVALKELGFDEPCFGNYEDGKDSFYLFEQNFKENTNSYYDEEVSAPLKQQVFKWFRENHQLNSWVYNSDLNKYFFTILQNGRIVKANKSFLTYEEAELACLNKLIEIVKNDNTSKQKIYDNQRIW